MTTTTDTPRTDAARFEALRGAALRKDCIPLKLGQELERELAAEIANRKKCCRDGNQISDELFDTQLKLKSSQAEVERLHREFLRKVSEKASEARQKAETELCCEREKSQKLEAEAERLKANLRRAIEIAEIFAEWIGEYEGDDCGYDLRAELDQLKATLNPDNK